MKSNMYWSEISHWKNKNNHYFDSLNLFGFILNSGDGCGRMYSVSRYKGYYEK